MVGSPDIESDYVGTFLFAYDNAEGRVILCIR